MRVCLFVLSVLALDALAALTPMTQFPEAALQHVYCDTTLGACGMTTQGAGNMVRSASVGVNNNGQSVNGWDALYVRADPALINTPNEDLAYYAAGFGEGYVTNQRIYQMYQNLAIREVRANLSSYANDWISTHVSFMQSNSAAKKESDPYWNEVHNQLRQIDGLTDGFNHAAGPVYNLTLAWDDVFMISFIFEVYDVITAMSRIHGVNSTMSHAQKMKAKAYGTHCSAMIKPVPGDVLVTHTTWSSLESMLRQYKVYEFGDYRVSFTSYPATVHSGDDMYTLSSGFSVLETTNENYNNESAPYVLPQSVSEFIRVMVSNKLAKSGAQWGDTFCKAGLNSGTYNNQWMIVNLNLIQTNGSNGSGNFTLRTAGSLQIVEQMPNLCISRDESAYATAQGYWSSYNRPFFNETYHVAGTYAMWQQLGDYFSYNLTYRHRIFARNASDVKDVATLQNLIRFNDYQNDPLSVVDYNYNCPQCDKRNAELSISARADLTLASQDFGNLAFDIGYQDLAAIDGKVVSLKSVLDDNNNMWVINGPMHGGASNIPVFDWASFEATHPQVPHFGIPEVMNFSWVDANAAVLSTIAQPFPLYSQALQEISAVFKNNDTTKTFVPQQFEEAVLAVVLSQLNSSSTSSVSSTLLSSQHSSPARLLWMLMLVGSPVTSQSNGALFADTSIRVISSAATSDLSTTFVFTFVGPSSVQYQNIFLHTLHADLAVVGISQATVVVPTQSDDADSKKIVIIAATCSAAFAAVFVVMLVLRKKRAEELGPSDSGLKDIPYSKLV